MAEPPKPKRWRRLLIWGVLVLISLYLLRFQWLPPIASWLNVSEPRLPVRYVVPLPGGNDMRPFAAAGMIRAGLAETAVVLRNEATPDSADGIVMPMHEVTSQVLLKRGVPADKILTLEGESRSTFSDFQIIGGIWDREPDATVAIITNPAHTRRARWVADKVLPQSADQICVIAAINDSYHEHIWWQSEEGVNAILSEYLKLAFYAIKYSSPAKRAAWVATLLGIGFAIGWMRRRRRLGHLAHQKSSLVSGTSIA